MSGRKSVRDAATGELKLVPRKSPPRKDKVFRRLEQSVPREEWLQALEAAGDERAQHLMARMMDPSFAKHSLPQLAKDSGLTYPQLLKLITQHRLDQGLLRMSSHIPQVLEDVAVDSQSTMVPCPGCMGEGKLYDRVQETDDAGQLVYDPTTKKPLMKTVESKCWSCDGVGKLRKIGDADSRKLMFDTLQLTGRKGPLVAQQFINAGGQSVEDALDTVASVLDVKVEPQTP
jgi:hypothetical protein